MTNSIWQSTIQKDNGDIVAGAEIEVVVESSGLPATIFSTRGGAALSNPFFADSNGFAQFYAGPEEYRITATDTGTGLAQTWRYVRLGDGGSHDVQTSPTDTTADRVVTTDALGGNGGPIWTEDTYQPETSLGLGFVIGMRNISGGSISNGGTTAGANVKVYGFTSAGDITQLSATPAGTWKNVSGNTIATGAYGFFVRIS